MNITKRNKVSPQLDSIEFSIVKPENEIEEINRLHAEINTELRVSVDKAIRIGQLLTEERKRHKHGEWLPWLKENVHFSQQTANNYQRVYQQKDKLLNVGNLSEAYRLSLPGKKRKSKIAKSLLVRTFTGVTCRIEAPPKSWHIGINSQAPESENAQVVICSRCWAYSAGGINVTKQLGSSWVFECKCPDGQSDHTYRNGSVIEANS